MEDQLYRCHTWACKESTGKVGGQPSIWVNELDLSKQQNGTATIIQIISNKLVKTCKERGW